MGYYEDLYRSGHHERAWAAMRALGAGIHREPHIADARAVAAETMRRVRRNLERIVARLEAAGYQFGFYPDGQERDAGGPLVPSSDKTRADVAALAARIGPLPLSLEAFWNEVGSVELIGMHASLPAMSDPLDIAPPEWALSELGDWDEEDEEERFTPYFHAPLGGDDYHKDNVSGGPPYSVLLPHPGADFELMYERHGMAFVSYLRLAILRWGGFPGMDGRDERWELIPTLIAGLEPF